MTDKPVMRYIKNCFFSSCVRCQQHQSHKFEHRLHDYFFEMKGVRGSTSCLNNIFVILLHNFLNIFKLLLIFESSTVQKSNFQRLQSKCIFSYCRNPANKINLSLIYTLLLFEIQVMVII